MKWVIWLVAIASTSALVALWFWEVRRLLRQHRSMVESARCQLRFESGRQRLRAMLM